MLCISGLTMLFFMSSESSTHPDASEFSQIRIPEPMKNQVFDQDESSLGESSLGEVRIFGSCSMANIIIGKNGIANCDN